MTVIVWDGVTLAVDSGALKGDTLHRADKVRFTRDNTALLTGHGDARLVLQLVDWYMAGHDSLTFPMSAGFSHSPAELVRLDAEGLWRYETEMPIHHGTNACAFGDGADFAYGALAVGADAEHAALAACRYSRSCAPPIQLYRVEGGRVVKVPTEEGE